MEMDTAKVDSMVQLERHKAKFILLI